MPTATILVVDDDPELRSIMNRLLRCGGYAVYEARDGETAMTLIEKHSYDVVIADQVLHGDVDGMTLLTHHSRISPSKGRILLTGWFSDQLFRICQDIGALYVSKPCSLDQLKNKIEGLLASSRTAL